MNRAASLVKMEAARGGAEGRADNIRSQREPSGDGGDMRSIEEILADLKDAPEKQLVMLTIFKTERISHFEQTCEQDQNVVQRAMFVSLEHLLENPDEYCHRCIDKSEMLELDQSYSLYKKALALLEEAIKNPTEKTLKEVYEVSVIGAKKLNAHAWAGLWSFELFDDINDKMQELIRRNSEELEKELAQKLELSVIGEDKIILEGVVLPLKKAGALDEFQKYFLLPALYRHDIEWIDYWVLPAAYEKLLLAEEYAKIKSFTKENAKTMEVLISDGGIYDNIIEAAKAAKEL